MKYYVREIIKGVCTPSLDNADRDLTVGPRLPFVRALADGKGFAQIKDKKVIAMFSFSEVIIEAVMDPSPDMNLIVQNLED